MELNLIEIIQNLGFPIAVCFYLLVRVEKSIGELKASIEKLSLIISEKAA